jgi:aspartate kinase
VFDAQAALARDTRGWRVAALAPHAIDDLEPEIGRLYGEAIEALRGAGIAPEEILTDEQIGKVSIVGAGMRSHPGVAAQVFRVLGEEGINIEMISTSPIKISCVISADRVADGVRALHESFGLGAESVQREEPTGVHHRAKVPEA